jgi:hypothetical protein
MSLEHSLARQKQSGLQPLVFTVDSFCTTHAISRSRLYEEWRAGRGPRFYLEGAHRRITAEAAAEYRAYREASAASASRSPKCDGKAV